MDPAGIGNADDRCSEWWCQRPLLAVSPPYRVLYVATGGKIAGGGLRSLEAMLRGLDRRQFQPGLLLDRDGEMLQVGRALDIPVQIVPRPLRELSRLPAWWRSLWLTARVVSRLRPHIVHSNGAYSCQALSIVARRARIPRVIHLRFPISAVALAWWVPGGCEQILCVSRFVREELGDTAGTAVAGAQVSVIHDGVPWVKPDAEGGAPELRDGRGDPKRIRLGFVGRLVQVKGVDILLQALAKVPASQRPLLLVAGGNAENPDDYERWLRQLAVSLGVAEDVVWLGFVDDVSRVYRQVDAVACPSRVESFSLVPLEAAQFAVPVIASDVGGFPELIQHGHNGLLVAPTVEEWTAALVAIQSRQQWSALGLAARNTVSTHFSAQAYQRSLTDVYLRLLGRADGGP